MAETYNDASVPSTSATVLGSGLQPLQAYLQQKDRNDQAELQRQKMRDARKELRNKRLNKLLEYNAPETAWKPFQYQLADYANKQVRQRTIEAISSGESWQQIAAEQPKWVDDVNTRKAMYDGEQAKYSEYQKMVDGDSRYIDKKYYQDIGHDAYFDSNGNPKDPSEWQPEMLDEAYNDVSGYNWSTIVDDVVEQFPDQVTDYAKKVYNSSGDPQWQIDQVKQKTIAEPGEDGSMRLKDDPVTWAVIKQNPWVQRGINAIGENAVKEKFKPFLRQDKDISFRNIPKDRGSGDDEKTTIVSDDNRRGSTMAVNFMSDAVEGTRVKKDVYVADSKRFNLKGKETEDDMLLEGVRYFNIEDGKFEDFVGDVRVTPTRIKYLPVIRKDDPLSGKEQVVPTGEVSSPEELKERLRNGLIEMKWYVQGNAAAIDESGKRVGKPVLIPYDEVRDDVKAKFGYDLDERDKSDLTQVEVIQMINEMNPDASTEEKLEMFKQIMAERNAN